MKPKPVSVKRVQSRKEAQKAAIDQIRSLAVRVSGAACRELLARVKRDGKSPRVVVEAMVLESVAGRNHETMGQHFARLYDEGKSVEDAAWEAIKADIARGPAPASLYRAPDRSVREVRAAVRKGVRK